MPTGHRKLEKLSELLGKLRKSYRKAIGRSSTRFTITTNSNGNNSTPQMAYPCSVKDNERRRQCRFSLSSSSTLHISSSASECALLFWYCARHWAQNVFLRHESISRIKRKKETLNVLLFTQKTRIRNVRRTSKHFSTTKVHFLTIKVVLGITRTITVFRNVTDDFRRENQRLAYGSWPYM